MHRRTLLTATLGTGLGACLPCAAAQPPRGPARIGWLTAQGEASLAPFLPVMRAALPISAMSRDTS